MKNADMPAMPIELNGFGQLAPEALYQTLTKREMFAMHAMQGLSTSGGEGWLIAHAHVIAVKSPTHPIAELEKNQ